MLRLVTDEHVHGGLARGMRSDHPEIDIVRVQDVGLLGASDPAILAGAAQESRVCISQDRKTMIRYANERVSGGLSMPGLFILRKDITVGEAIAELFLIAQCSSAEEWQDRIEFIPF